MGWDSHHALRRSGWIPPCVRRVSNRTTTWETNDTLTRGRNRAGPAVVISICGTRAIRARRRGQIVIITYVSALYIEHKSMSAAQLSDQNLALERRSA